MIPKLLITLKSLIRMLKLQKKLTLRKMLIKMQTKQRM